MHSSVTAVTLAVLCCNAIKVNAHPGRLHYNEIQLERRQSASPGGVLPDNFTEHPYIPQQPTWVRSPCPALNTLANHGYLNRNGSEISRGDLSTAFAAGFGVGQSVIETAITNAFAVCQMDQGSECETFNLDQLNRPFTFEHDHSFSRQDYLMIWGNGFPIDNFEFNRSIFGNTLQAFQGSNTANIAQFDEARLVRESNAYLIDGASNFHPNYFTQLEEIGFIFAVMRNFNASRNGVPIASPNNELDQTIQIDWWMFWFTREEFPVQLGWLKPAQTVDAPYVTTIRSSIFSATATSSPKPSAPGVASPLTPVPLSASGAGKRDLAKISANPSPSTLPEITRPITYTGIVSSTPLPKTPLISLPNIGSIVTLLPSQLSQISSGIKAAGVPSPTPIFPYQIAYAASDFEAYSTSIVAYQSAFTSVAESVLKHLMKKEAAPEPTPAPQL